MISCAIFRLDWNLLSTATPAINAWMKPAHRSIMASKILVAHFKQRVSTVMACIMTEALDVPSIHVPVKVFSKQKKPREMCCSFLEPNLCGLLAMTAAHTMFDSLFATEINFKSSGGPHKGHFGLRTWDTSFARIYKVLHFWS